MPGEVGQSKSKSKKQRGKLKERGVERREETATVSHDSNN